METPFQSMVVVKVATAMQKTVFVPPGGSRLNAISSLIDNIISQRACQLRSVILTQSLSLEEYLLYTPVLLSPRAGGKIMPSFHPLTIGSLPWYIMDRLSIIYYLQRFLFSVGFFAECVIHHCSLYIVSQVSFFSQHHSCNCTQRGKVFPSER
jgi:hypothetical protein